MYCDSRYNTFTGLDMAVIGIDLGTTNSACGVMTKHGATLIPNRLGEQLTPSVISVDPNGAVIVGQSAKERLVKHPKSTVANFKRSMGSDRKISLGKHSLSPTELSSLVLMSLKQDAEEWLGESVTQAVISVPAYFNDHQRQATRQAGELAGLQVDRLINEPTAAALAYGLNEHADGTFLILDMGGGTFDVSLIEFFDNVMEVHASAGDNFLGGEDFSEAILDGVLNDLNINRKKLDRAQNQTLYNQLEYIKKNSKRLQSQSIKLKIKNKQVEWSVSQKWLESTFTPLLLRAKKPIKQAVNDSGISPDDIDDVILVGGATRLPYFRSMIGRMFGRLPSCHLDPDTVVALGATVQAGLKQRHRAVDDIVLTDVTPYTMGIGVVNYETLGDDRYAPIIERNSTVPISRTMRVSTISDNQERVVTKIFQGENRLVKNNVYLGEIAFPVPKSKEGKESVDIRFSYDMNGVLEIDGTVISTGEEHHRTIELNPGSLTDDQKDASRKRLAAIKFHPREDESNLVLISRAERLYESTLGQRRGVISDYISQFEAILDTQNHLDILKAREGFSNFLDFIDDEDWEQ